MNQKNETAPSTEQQQMNIDAIAQARIIELEQRVDALLTALNSFHRENVVLKEAVKRYQQNLSSAGDIANAVADPAHDGDSHTVS